jgi:hypothetical protein
MLLHFSDCKFSGIKEAEIVCILERSYLSS